MRLRGTRGPCQLLVDSGSSINLIKNRCVLEVTEKIQYKKSFLMGKNEHCSKEVVKLTILNKIHLLHIVLDDYPIPEDGILGLPLMDAYNFKFSNLHFNLDSNSDYSMGGLSFLFNQCPSAVG